jgi:hypothetical protein
VEGVRGSPGAPGHLVVELPLPPSQASPNARGHWGKRARATSSYRHACGFLAIAARNAAEWAIPKTATIHVSYRSARIYCKRDNTYHPKDEDNARAALKGAIDALKDAGVILSDAHGRLRWGQFNLITRLRDMRRLGLTNGVTFTIEPGWPGN